MTRLRHNPTNTSSNTSTSVISTEHFCLNNKYYTLPKGLSDILHTMWLFEWLPSWLTTLLNLSLESVVQDIHDYNKKLQENTNKALQKNMLQETKTHILEMLTIYGFSAWRTRRLLHAWLNLISDELKKIQPNPQTKTTTYQYVSQTLSIGPMPPIVVLKPTVPLVINTRIPLDTKSCHAAARTHLERLDVLMASVQTLREERAKISFSPYPPHQI